MSSQAQETLLSERAGLAMAFAAYFSNEFFGDAPFIARQTAATLGPFLSSEAVSSALADGGWRLAWGPACWQAPLSRIADHTAFVARSAARPRTLLVAICGTHPLSLVAWVTNNFDVARCIPWGDGDAKISAGTASGLQIVRSLRDPTSGATIEEFLRSEVSCSRSSSGDGDEPWNVGVCGHSLGGALSPALALRLREDRAIWDPSERAVVHCFSFAGPTIGNEAFAAHYDALLGATTTRIANDRDVVPHAWTEAGMQKMLSLYEPLIHTPRVLKLAIPLVRRALSCTNFKHICSGQHPISGPEPVAGRDFMVEVAFQHVQPYIEHERLTELAPLLAAHVPLFSELFTNQVANSVQGIAKLKTLLGMHNSSKAAHAKEEESTATATAAAAEEKEATPPVVNKGADEDKESDQ